MSEPRAVPVNLQTQLLYCARAAIAGKLGLPLPPSSDSLPTDEGASFVSLYTGSRLHGCVGSLEPYRPLQEDITGNACLAAFNDPRSAPLSFDQWSQLRISIAVLSAQQPVVVAHERELLKQLRPRLDGLVLYWQQIRATFLPAVWSQLPEPEQFLRQLKRKAGLPADFWTPELHFTRYTAVTFSDPDVP